MAWLHAAAVLALAGWIYTLLQRMPPPYDDRAAEVIPPERLKLYPGLEHGSTFPPDFSGPFSPNDKLKYARRLFVGEIEGSESVAVTPSGELLMLDKFGVLHRARPAKSGGGDRLAFELVRDSSVPPLYIGPGRPLGFHVVDDGGALLVCDSLKGLLKVTLPEAGGNAAGGAGTIEVLANRITSTGEPLNYINDLDVAADGTVYFTSSTAGTVGRSPVGFYDTMKSYLFNLLAGDSTGRLLVWRPESHEVVPLLHNISYANGVAVSADGSFVAVVETHTCRVLRYWLRGPKKGTHDVLVDKLPGFPDGITRSSSGGFWVSLVVPLVPIIKYTGSQPWLRHLLSHVITTVLPFVAKRFGCVVQLDASGSPIDTLMDMDGAVVSTVSAVTETDGLLFLGNLGGSGVSVVAL